MGGALTLGTLPSVDWYRTVVLNALGDVERKEEEHREDVDAL
eukprot:CAMPEP_0196138970 /NCGR_PEP_ID=MMETSP0910-20130528/6419_1 /TAXON_ID=49265 /ORGANISM="Thalassiosira rotula, Strain GSO102" /LENGTH=41 /DNA_ID= /DNA_START= /DNA_END= /DNA_ORIENTATION=